MLSATLSFKSSHFIIANDGRPLPLLPVRISSPTIKKTVLCLNDDVHPRPWLRFRRPLDILLVNLDSTIVMSRPSKDTPDYECGKTKHPEKSFLGTYSLEMPAHSRFPHFGPGPAHRRLVKILVQNQTILSGLLRFHS